MLTNAKFSLKAITIATIFLGLMTSCSTQKDSNKNVKNINNVPVLTKDAEKNNVSAQFYLEQAKDQRSIPALGSLVSASEQYLLEGNVHQALWLANQICPLLAISTTPNSTEHITNSTKINSGETNLIDVSWYYRLVLIKAASLQILEQPQLAAKQLQKADEYAQENNIEHQRSYYKLVQITAQENHLIVDALYAQLVAFSLDGTAGEEEIFKLWQALSTLSQWQVSQLAGSKPPYFLGWKKLLAYAHKYGDKPATFNRALQKWQQTFPSHPANALVASLKIPDNDVIGQITKVAVILPLSGRQKSAGEAAQQGILTAYQDAPEKELLFLDATKLDMATLNTFFIENDINFVIGPLLKTNVESYLAQTELTVPTLLLNLPSSALLAHQKVLSMRREDEAVQAATTLSQRHYKHPIVLSSKSNVSTRIANAFVEQWQVMNDQSPEIIYFSQGNKMQNDLKASLEVDASQLRVNEIKRRVKQKVKFELRNRRDVDMIYLVGSPKQTRLLKPYIDVNISPFAKVIPVFASSLSHSAKEDKNDNRDLLGLTFTEIPWLLSSKQQNKALAQTSRALWSQRSDSLQRIFAMGFDSLQLIDKLAVMENKPYVRHFGQTGILKLNDNNILTRSLIWGRYRKNNVAQVAME